MRPVFFGELRSQETFRLQKPRILRLVSTPVSPQMIEYTSVYPTFIHHGHKYEKTGCV